MQRTRMIKSCEERQELRKWLLELYRVKLTFTHVDVGCTIFRYNVNKATEDEIRSYNARMKPIWDAQAAAEKAKANKEEMEKLAKEFR